MTGPRGRRVAVRPGRGTGGPGARVVAAVVLPFLVGLLAWSAPGQSASDTEAPDPRQVPVDQVTLVCPPAGPRGSVVVARPHVGTDRTTSPVSVGTADSLDGSFDLVTGPTVRPDVGRGPLALRAEGPGAPGLFAETVVPGAASASGTEAAACGSPGTRWWFPGAGGGVGHRSTLLVTNADEGPAVMDVRLHGVDGVVPTESLRGLTLAPGATRSVALADVAPGREILTVQVRVVRGRVVAAMQEEGAGAAWVAPAAEPAAAQRVPAVPPGRGRTLLTVTNPGRTAASGTIRVVTPTGSFVPVEPGSFLVEPGAVVSLDLSQAVGTEAVAVEVAADAALVAGLRKTVRSSGDVAAVSSTPALAGPGAAGAGPGRSALHLSAGEASAAARARAVSAAGELLAEETLVVGSGSLVTWALPRAAAYVVVLPSRGAPFAAVVRSGAGGSVAAVPVRPLPLEVTVPAVLPQPAS